MTTENQNTTNESNFSKAATLGKSLGKKGAEKASATFKTLSLRPTKSVKKNTSFKPTKKLR